MQDTLQSSRRIGLRVFLCHSSGDKASVRALHCRLKTSGFEPWLDELELLPGQNWREEISAAIRTSHVVVVCLSRQSVTKEGYLQREIREALSRAEEKPERAIFIIPARLEDVEVPAQLSQWQWADLFDNTGYSRIITALETRANELGITETRVPTHIDDLIQTDALQSLDPILEILSDFIDSKEAQSSGHTWRVTGYSIALARSMELPVREIRLLARAAFLHDVGISAVPDEILRKPGKLTDQEHQLLRTHCQRGYEILRKIPLFSEVADVVYAHHEHYDGTGYPRGLRASEIPLGARIFAVADALDAITSDRPYRIGSSLNVARDTIQRCSGTQFDPDVVGAFLILPTRLIEDLREELRRVKATGKTLSV